MFNLTVAVTIRNASNVIFSGEELIALLPKKFQFGGSITRTVTSDQIYNAFDASRGYSIPRNGYVCELTALGASCNNFVLSATLENGTEYTVRCTLRAMGKHSLSIIISASSTDAVSRVVKASVMPYIADTTINQARRRAIASGRQASSELLGAKLPSRVKIHEQASSELLGAELPSSVKLNEDVAV